MVLELVRSVRTFAHDSSSLSRLLRDACAFFRTDSPFLVHSSRLLAFGDYFETTQATLAETFTEPYGVNGRLLALLAAQYCGDSPPVSNCIRSYNS